MSDDTPIAEEMMYRATDPVEMSVRSEGDELTMDGRMMPYGEWTEVKSRSEGHFMERFAPGSLAKTITEQASRIRALFEHGMDVTMGRQAIAVIDSMQEKDDGAYFRATLLDGIPSLIVSGLKRGLYGSSIRFNPLKMDRDRSPRRSAWNPDGIEERTVREASMREFSVTAFPVYPGATAHIRSITDEILLGRFADDPERLEEMIEFMKSKRSVPAEPPSATFTVTVGGVSTSANSTAAVGEIVVAELVKHGSRSTTPEPDPPEDTTPPAEPEPPAATTRAEPGTPIKQRFDTREDWQKWISTRI